MTTRTRWIITVVLLLAAVAWGALQLWPRGEALGDALKPVMEGKDEQALVAHAIWQSYVETRGDAARWSFVYWTCTFAAALLSALAALVLKLETVVKDQGTKKDLAAALSVAAALLVTISTSGDFQRKWQANRIAAAELERTGYEFLEKKGAEPRSYFGPISQTLLQRHLAIAGTSDQRTPAREAAEKGASQPR